MTKKYNKNNLSIFQNLGILWNSLSRKRRLRFFQLLFLLLLGGIAEMASLGAIIPFLAILINPQEALNIPFVLYVLQSFNLDVYGDFYGKMIVLFSTVIITAYVVRFLLTYVTVKFNYELVHDLGIGIYKNVLYEPYNIHISRNSSEIIGGFNKLDLFIWMVLTTLNALSSLVLILFITFTLILISPILTLVILFGLGLTYGFFYLLFKNRLKNNSNIISINSNKRVQAIQEGIGSIRDILLDNSQESFLNIFKKLDWEMRSAQTNNEIIGPAPRYLIEVMGIIFIVIFAYISINQNGDASSLLPTIGVLVIGLQRLIPLGQQVYYGWTRFTGHTEIFYDIVKLIEEQRFVEKIKPKDLIFNQKIEFKGVSFSYQKHLPLILNNLNFEITKGTRIAIIGKTGSGKSTIVDLIMGLLEPSDGKIIIDGVELTKEYIESWRKNIAHVPQDVYLLDASFLENIAFGKKYDEIDIERVFWSSKKAQIANFIEQCDQGYDTLIGERGVSLSGGQKQRIAIARALYKRSSILVFDEATSALDEDTEKSLVSSIELLGQDITTITIAHRLSTVDNADWVYKLNQGCIEDKGTPKDML
jgi:ATP-binding cassette, subfamily B, bacterial PglK